MTITKENNMYKDERQTKQTKTMLIHTKYVGEFSDNKCEKRGNINPRKQKYKTR